MPDVVGDVCVATSIGMGWAPLVGVDSDVVCVGSVSLFVREWSLGVTVVVFRSITVVSNGIAVGGVTGTASVRDSCAVAFEVWPPHLATVSGPSL